MWAWNGGAKTHGTCAAHPPSDCVRHAGQMGPSHNGSDLCRQADHREGSPTDDETGAGHRMV